MIKNIVSGLIAVAVLATPVAAEARHRDGERGRHHRGLNTGEAIALGVGAFILGAAVNGNRREDRTRQEDRQVEREVYEREYEYHYRRQCYDAIQTRYDYYGRPYYQRVTRCN